MMFQRHLIIWLLALTSIFQFSESLNILVLFPTVAKTHYKSYERLFLELATRHNVTIINYMDDQTTIGDATHNFRQIGTGDDIQQINMRLFSDKRTDMHFEPFMVNSLLGRPCRMFINSKYVQNFLKEDLKFDVIVAELFGTCYLGLMKKFNAPIVGLSSTDILPWMYQWFGSPENPSYIPVIFMDYADKLNFFQRVENTLMLLYSKLVHLYFIAPSGNEFSKKHLGIDLYEGGDVLYNISLLLVNRHYTFQTPKPLSPNIIEVGGIHLGKPKRLPQDLENIVQMSPHGTILMSMGSTLKGSTFPEEQRKIFLKVFAQLKQTIIWKWENSTMEGLPENVKIYNWVPQLDLLCNPNIKLFITHGGLLGSQEAVNCGVPMLILPQFADQHFNAAALSKSGAVLSLRLRSITEETLLEAIRKALTPEFAKNAKALSERFKDRPMSPMDTAIYWIEYVARHKGAPFMKTAVTDMPFYQYLLLDVIGFLILLLVVYIYIFYFSIKTVIRILFYIRPKPKTKTS